MPTRPSLVDPSTSSPDCAPWRIASHVPPAAQTQPAVVMVSLTNAHLPWVAPEEDWNAVNEVVSLQDIGHTITGLTGVPWDHLTPTDGMDQSVALRGGTLVRPMGVGVVHEPRSGLNAAWLSATSSQKAIAQRRWPSRRRPVSNRWQHVKAPSNRLGLRASEVAMRLSILDLAGVVEGGTIAQALERTVATAQGAETWGYDRFWVAEHHSMPGVASAATAVLIGHIAGKTSTLRVGAGGIMLPNHSPLVVAEQFGTLDALYPGRIDLGLGRAPGTDQPTARALRHRPAGADVYPREVQELLGFLEPAQPNQAVIAVPGAGADVPVWILGSSPFSAQLAAALGLPYAFASHFAPTHLMQALSLYHQHFEPSKYLSKPHVMVAVNAIAAETESEARFLSTSHQQVFLDLRRGLRPQAKPPRELDLSPGERQLLDSVLGYSFIGTPAQVHAGLEEVIQQTRADEIMVVCSVYDHDKRLRSLQMTADA